MGLARRAVILTVAAGVVAGVYACSDGGPAAPRARVRAIAGPSPTVVTPGVVTLCKVGTGA
jgi:hypothetical protein